MSNQNYIPKIKTGVCKCGHMWDDHHLGVVMNSDALKVHKEQMVCAILPTPAPANQAICKPLMAARMPCARI
jgi:hypothetical protein